MRTVQFMRLLEKFKAQMTGPHAPNYVRRYCEDLNGQKWEWFYAQMKNAMEVAVDTDRLMYVLKWILKTDFDDLVYEVYFQDYMNPEMFPDSLIKEEWQDVLYGRYKERLMADICPSEGGYAL